MQRGNPISKLTAAGLEDIKYIVDPDAVSEMLVSNEFDNVISLSMVRTNAYNTYVLQGSR